jgi:hypothetical protein
VGALLDYMASLAQDDSREDEDIGGAVGLLTAVAKSYPIVSPKALIFTVSYLQYV